MSCHRACVLLFSERLKGHAVGFIFYTLHLPQPKTGRFVSGSGAAIKGRAAVSTAWRADRTCLSSRPAHIHRDVSLGGGRAWA